MMDEIVEWVVLAILLAVAAPVTLWMVGAIYYDLCGGAAWGRWLALGWLGGVVALFAFWKPLWQPFAVVLGVAAVFLAWWLRQKPRHDRDWQPEVAVLPRAVRDGDAVMIESKKARIAATDVPLPATMPPVQLLPEFYPTAFRRIAAPPLDSLSPFGLTFYPKNADTWVEWLPETTPTTASLCCRARSTCSSSRLSSSDRVTARA